MSNNANSASHNVASPDALIVVDTVHTNPTSSQSNSVETAKDTSRKRKRFTKPISKRRGGAAYSSKTKISSLNIHPRLQVFPIFTSNLGCYMLSASCFAVMQGKDYRLAQAITFPQLAYMTHVAFCNRLVQCALYYGYAFPDHASRLRQVASGIQLPAVLATYVESIGHVTMANGSSVVPFCSDFHQLFPEDSEVMVHPMHMLAQGDREMPNTPWALDIDWILEYNSSTTRAARTGMNFRSVDNSSFLGRNEMLVSYRALYDDTLLPEVPQTLSEAEAQLGATYHFRDYGDIGVWLGQNQALLFNAFIAIPFDYRVLFNDLCVAAFKGMHVSVE